MTKKILVVDDSALMRRVLCDIINSDERFEVSDRAMDGQEALELLKKNSYRSEERRVGKECDLKWCWM